MPFKAEHLGTLKPRFWDLLDYQSSNIQTVGQALEAGGPAWSLVDDSKVISCGGLILLHKGVAEAWFIGGDAIDKYPILIYKLVKRAIRSSAAAFGIIRIQAHINEEHEIGLMWATRLGFEIEAKLKKYGIMGQDVFLAVHFPNEGK